jgi:TonB-dependent starch-binding outer membrane protein SusC
MTGSNNSSVAGFIPVNFGNPNVTWESTTTLNLGLNAYLLNNTINLGIDVWERNTNDMLYRIGIPAVGGVGTHPFVNIGSMKNKGFDLELGYRNTAIAGRFRYSANLVLSRYVNEIVKLSDNVEEEIVTGENRQMFYLRATTGTAFPEFYGYIADGFFDTADEVAAHPKAFGSGGTYNAIGRIKYRDLNDDGVIDARDMTYIGNPHPDLTGGLNIELGYGNFDLSVLLYGSYGNDIIHYARRSMEYSLGNGNSVKDRLYKSWGSPYLNGDNSKATIAIADDNVGSEQPSTLFVEDGSYLRVKTLLLSYNLPNSLTSKLTMKGLRVYAQLTNPFTFTKYTGLDPDLDTGGYGMGIDRGTWPTIRQMIFGLSLNL